MNRKFKVLHETYGKPGTILNEEDIENKDFIPILIQRGGIEEVIEPEPVPTPEAATTPIEPEVTLTDVQANSEALGNAAPAVAEFTQAVAQLNEPSQAQSSEASNNAPQEQPTSVATEVAPTEQSEAAPEESPASQPEAEVESTPATEAVDVEPSDESHSHVEEESVSPSNEQSPTPTE